MAAHILQTTPWGQFKANFGWTPETLQLGAQNALVLFRRLPLGFTLAYVPRGPQAQWERPAELRELVTALDQVCRRHRAICLKFEPDLPDTIAHHQTLSAQGFRPSPHPVQPRRSIVIDLSGTEDEVLGRMKQKTRYNVRLAAKKDVTCAPVQTPEALEKFVALMTVTGARDGFAVHSADYYRQAYAQFHPLGQCELFLAEYQGQPLAGVMAFLYGEWAWYFYGASSDQERQRMAPYLAQWEAMRWAKARGARYYDLWGVPDEDEAVLEAEFENRHEGLWGVYRFKRGWGGQLTRTVGAWDRVYQPLLYQAYVWYLKRRQITAEG